MRKPEVYVGKKIKSLTARANMLAGQAKLAEDE